MQNLKAMQAHIKFLLFFSFTFNFFYCASVMETSHSSDNEIRLTAEEKKLTTEELLTRSIQQLRFLKNEGVSDDAPDVMRLKRLITLLLAAVKQKKDREVEVDEAEDGNKTPKAKMKKLLSPLKNKKATRDPKDPLYKKGLIFKATGIEDVYAPIAGVVTYAQQTSVLKYVVIIESEDNKNYVLTGIDLIKIKEGDKVKENDIIGQTKPGSEIYLEVYDQ